MLGEVSRPWPGKLAPKCSQAHAPFPSVSFPHAAPRAPTSLRDQRCCQPGDFIPVFPSWRPGPSRDLSIQSCSRAQPPFSSTGCSLGRSESLEQSLSLCRGVGCREGVVAGGWHPGDGGPTTVFFGPLLPLSKSGVLFWSGAHVSDGLSLAGPWFSLAVKVLFTAFCPERATVFGGRERLLFMPHHD